MNPQSGLPRGIDEGMAALVAVTEGLLTAIEQEDLDEIQRQLERRGEMIAELEPRVVKFRAEHGARAAAMVEAAAAPMHALAARAHEALDRYRGQRREGVEKLIREARAIRSYEPQPPALSSLDRST